MNTTREIDRSNSHSKKPVSTRVYYLILSLFTVLNLFVSSTVQIIEAFNEKLRIANYISTSSIVSDCVNAETRTMHPFTPDSYSEHILLRTIFCMELNSNSFPRYSAEALDNYAQTSWLSTNPKATTDYINNLLAAVNKNGNEAFFIGSIIGYLLCFIVFRAVKSRQRVFNILFCVFIGVSNLSINALYIYFLQKNIKIEEVEYLLPILILSRGLTGMTLSIFNYYVNTNISRIIGSGKGREAKLAYFGALQTISGSLAFVISIVFSYIYLQYTYAIFSALVTLILGVSIVLVVITNLLIPRESIQEEREDTLELEEIPFTDLAQESGSAANKPAVETPQEIKKKDIVGYIKTFFSWCPPILLVFPIFVFMSGVNLFLYYKDIFLSSTYGLSSSIFLSSPLIGGLIILFIGKRVNMKKLSIFGFISVGVLEVILYCVKKGLFPYYNTAVLDSSLPILIMIILNFAIIPLFGIIPHYIGKSSSSIFIVYGLISQIANLACFTALSSLYQKIGIDFLVLCAISMGLGGIFSHYLLKKKECI